MGQWSAYRNTHKRPESLHLLRRAVRAPDRVMQNVVCAHVIGVDAARNLHRWRPIRPYNPGMRCRLSAEQAWRNAGSGRTQMTGRFSLLAPAIALSRLKPPTAQRPICVSAACTPHTACCTFKLAACCCCSTRGAVVMSMVGIYHLMGVQPAGPSV